MKCPNCGHAMLDDSRGPKRIPLRSAREGCLHIAGNIKCFSETAVLLLAYPSAGFRRMPYLLTILGIDEAGKALKIIEKCLEVMDEDDESAVIVIDGWYHHLAKGPRAGEVGILAVEWLEEAMTSEPSLVGAEGKAENATFIESYREHLVRLKDRFSFERNSMIYIDYDETSDKWLIPTPPETGFVILDAVLLGLFSDIVSNCIDRGMSFSALNEEVQSIRRCKSFHEAIARVDELVGTELADIYRGISDTDDD